MSTHINAPTESHVAIRVGLRESAGIRELNRAVRDAGEEQQIPDPADDDHNYWAFAIQDGDAYYYQIGDIRVPVTEFEYKMAIANPSLYYFSIALKLHCRVQRAREENSNCGANT